MNTKLEYRLRFSLCNAGYSEETVDKILRWYAVPINHRIAKPKR
jgi:hypothetical protein